MKHDWSWLLYNYSLLVSNLHDVRHHFIDRYAEEDQRKAEKRREEIAQSKVEFVKANLEAISRKKQAKEMEKQR